MKRKPNLNPAKYPNRVYSLEEAREIRGPIVYGLLDFTGVFYIGKTTNPAARFKRYIKPRTTSLRLQRRVRDAGEDLRLVVLAHNPPDLFNAEIDWIERLGVSAVNIQWNGHRMLAHMGSLKKANAALETQLVTCPRCEGANTRHNKGALHLIRPSANCSIR